MTSTTTTLASTPGTTTQDGLALTARLLLAAIFLIAGVNKIGGMEGTVGYIDSVGLPFPELLYYATVALEIVGAIALIVGFKTREFAYALAAFSIAAAVIFHADFADQSQFNSFLKNCAIAGGMLQLAAFGPGRFSLDRT